MAEPLGAAKYALFNAATNNQIGNYGTFSFPKWFMHGLTEAVISEQNYSGAPMFFALTFDALKELVAMQEEGIYGVMTFEQFVTKHLIPGVPNEFQYASE